MSDSEIENIRQYVPQALEGIAHLIIIENNQKEPIAFMGIEKQKLEMLFISSEERNKGFGKQLIKYGIEKYGVNELVVNEQNPLARKFYEYIGFKVYKRSEVDEQGNHYPILYMRLES